MKSIYLFMLGCLLISKASFSQSKEVQDLIGKGIQAHDAGQYAAAIESYKKVLQLDSSNQLARYEMANSFFAMKNYQAALDQGMLLIRTNSKYKEESYILAGSCLDLLNKPKEAISLYQEGIKQTPTSYLLQYNLALTFYKMQNYAAAKLAVQESLQLKPKHASSHLLMGFIQKETGHRIKAMLCLYNFLFLDPLDPRAKNSINVLNSLIAKGVDKKNDSTINISISKNENESDEFQAAELMVALLSASSNLEENKKLSKQEQFVKNTESLFGMLGELKKNNKGFWWNYYVDYFSALAKEKHTEAFCYYILKSKDDKEIKDWIEKNSDKMKALFEWEENHKR